ncbi:MAG: hypothetical protein V1908_04770 [Candidatus Peregrinibacteria bacterium]
MTYVGLNLTEITNFDTTLKLACMPRREITLERVKELLVKEYKSCCHTEHAYILKLVKRRCEIDIKIDFLPLKYPLRKGDKVIIIFVCNIVHPPPTEGYSFEDMRKARIKFLLYTIS